GIGVAASWNTRRCGQDHRSQRAAANFVTGDRKKKAPHDTKARQAEAKMTGRKIIMAVKIERGGWVLIFLVGVALVGYSLNRYGVIDLSQWTGGGKKTVSGRRETVSAAKPLLLPASSTSSDAEVRVRLNVWVGCVGGLVANGGLDTQPDSIYGKKGLKVSFKI